MSHEENALQRKVRAVIGARPDVRIFRNNCGVAQYPTGARVRFGLFPGSSDLIGWRKVRITQDMVGDTIAQFLAIEVKSAKGKISAKQANFLRAVYCSGGCAGVVRSAEQAIELVATAGKTVERPAE